jgi:hypothetical protein
MTGSPELCSKPLVLSLSAVSSDQSHFWHGFGVCGYGYAKDMEIYAGSMPQRFGPMTTSLVHEDLSSCCEILYCTYNYKSSHVVVDRLMLAVVRINGLMTLRASSQEISCF